MKFSLLCKGGRQALSALFATGSPELTGNEGAPYTSWSIVGHGGLAPYTYSKVSGPAWMNVDATSGVVSGAVPTPGTTSGITIRVTDSLMATDDLDVFSVTIVGQSPAPAIANQTLYFGALTKAGHGAFPINTGGAVSKLCAINSGDASGHWFVDPATSEFYPTLAGDNAELSGGTYTLPCTFQNDEGSVNATITLVCTGTHPVCGANLATSYSARTRAHLMNILGATNAGSGSVNLADKTIICRYNNDTLYDNSAGSFTGMFTAIPDGQPLRVTSEDYNNPARFDAWNFGSNGAGNVTLDHLRFYRSYPSAAAYTALVSFPSTGAAKNVIIEDCDFTNNLRPYRLNPVTLQTVSRWCIGNLSCNNLTVQRCTGAYCLHFLGLNGTGHTIKDNVCHHMWADFANGRANGVTMEGNVHHDGIGNVKQIHPDFWQTFGATGGTCSNSVMRGNIMFLGTESYLHGASTQFSFHQSLGNGGGTYVNFVDEYNLTYIQTVHGETYEVKISSGSALNNTFMRDMRTGNATQAPNISHVGDPAVLIDYNVAESINYGGAINGSTNGGHNDIGTAWQGASVPQRAAHLQAHVDRFQGTTFAPLTRTEALNEARAKASGPLDLGGGVYIGAVGTTLANGPYDWTAVPYDDPELESRYNIAGRFTDITGAATNTVTESNELTLAGVTGTGCWVKLAAAAITAGFQFQVTNPEGNLVREYATAPMEWIHGYKLKLRVTSSASAATAKSGVIHCGTTSDTWSVTTA